MYEKYRELSWDLHNSVTSDRVIVNNSRRYFIKASLYRRWSSPTNRTICKHCNICRRLQPRPSILPFPLLFLRFLHRIFLEISSISHFPVFIRTRRQREINHPDEIRNQSSVKFPSLLEFSAQLILHFWTTAIEHWSKHRDKTKKKFLLWFTAWTSYDSLCDFFQKYSTHSRLQFHLKNTYSDSQ